MPPTATPTAIDSIVATSRSNLYRLLAGVFAAEPTLEFLQSLAEPALRDDLASAGVALPQAVGRHAEADVAEALAVEFATLFLVPGPKRLVPCESVVRGEGRYWGKATVEVKQTYEQFGYEVDELSSLPPDHLSVELEFMAYLTREEAAAAAGSDGETAADIREVERAFLNDHLVSWIGASAEQVAAAGKSDYYAGFARLARGFVQSELNELGAA